MDRYFDVNSFLGYVIIFQMWILRLKNVTKYQEVFEISASFFIT